MYSASKIGLVIWVSASFLKTLTIFKLLRKTHLPTPKPAGGSI